MDPHEIKCINRSNRENPYDKVEVIGGLNINGTRWRIPQSRAIEGIESGKWHFYININGNRLNIIISDINGNKYLKTESDSLFPDNLLKLPECPY